MFSNPLKPAKSPAALVIGVVFISFYVFVCNISANSAIGSVFSISFEKKSLPEAMEALADKSQTKITLIGDIEPQAVNSMQIENQSLPAMIKTILKRYGAENYAIIYDDKASAIKIRLLASSSSKENNFHPAPPSERSIVKGKLTPTRMFSDQDFARLLEKERAMTPEREFSEEDFKRLREKNVPMTEHREFSAKDFSKLTSQKTKIKQYPIFSSDDFARVQKTSDSKVQDKLFSEEDFANVLKNQQKEPIDNNGNITK